jgi:hypothetical protein
MARSTEWLITSAECIVAKRRARQSTPPGERSPESEREPEREPHPGPGFGGDRRLPEEDPGREQSTPTDEDEPDQPVGYPA